MAIEREAGGALKVCYVVSRFPTVSHTFISREVTALRGLGVEVDVVSVRTPSADEILAPQDKQDAATTFYILPPKASTIIPAHLKAMLRPKAYFSVLRWAVRRTNPGFKNRLWGAFYFAESLVVWSHCSKQGIRHLHAHFANVASDVCDLVTRYANSAGLVDGKKDGWSWSFTMHGPTEFSNVREFRLADKALSARLVICISDFCRSQLMAITPPSTWPKFEVVHCGIPLSKVRSANPAGSFPQAGLRSETRAGPELPSATATSPPARPLRLITVGRLVPEKGHYVVLHALAILRSEGVDARLVLVGDGPERAGIEKEIDAMDLGSSVELLGSVGQDKVPQLVADSDVFVLASFAEGVPVVLMEAMALRVPVVSTIIAGIPELISDGTSGLLVPPGRADLLAEALRRLLGDKSLCDRLVANAEMKVFSEFNSEATARRLSELFASCLYG